MNDGRTGLTIDGKPGFVCNCGDKCSCENCKCGCK